jgi:CDP-glucose 4,6-dehydratase
MKIFKSKKIIITGHTGFKGSWLALWLIKKGAEVVGISKDIPTQPSHYKLINLKKKLKKEYFVRIEEMKKIKKIFNKEKPDFIFHLAAQPIVSRSFNNPLETWYSNTFGTLSILESLKKIKKKTYVVMITSDKTYKNLELNRGYKEQDILGGDDPYSASKGSADILINSYVKSFFSKKKTNIFISVARAGNVIGGGDWSENRLIPDCVKSVSKNKKLILRNPYSTRPWQHVIEVVYGYMLLAKSLKNNKSLHGEAFNFGPKKNKNVSVLQIIKLMKKNWEKINWKIFNKKKFYESKLLFLNSNKAKKYLKWSSILSVQHTLKLVTEWYKCYYSKNSKISSISSIQIDHYEKILKKKK